MPNYIKSFRIELEKNSSFVGNITSALRKNVAIPFNRNILGRQGRKVVSNVGSGLKTVGSNLSKGGKMLVGGALGTAALGAGALGYAAIKSPGELSNVG